MIVIRLNKLAAPISSITEYYKKRPSPFDLFNKVFLHENFPDSWTNSNVAQITERSLTNQFKVQNIFIVKYFNSSRQKCI